MNRKKSIIMVVMCIMVIAMIVGYAAFVTKLNVNVTSNIISEWKVEIVNITSSITGEAYNIAEPTYNADEAFFNAGFNKPGDKMVYNVTVKNKGTVSVIINEIAAQEKGNPLIVYSIEDIQNKIRLGSGEELTFKVVIEFDYNATYIPEDASKTLAINIIAIQDDGQTLNPTNPEIEKINNTLGKSILLNNEAQSDTNIDFNKGNVTYYESRLIYTSDIDFTSDYKYFATGYSFDEATGEYKLSGTIISRKWSAMSSEYKTYPYTCKASSSSSTCTILYKVAGYKNATYGTGYKLESSVKYNNGNGLYYTSTNTENNKKVYYFRGNVENNYVSFAGQIWRIVRINEDGSIRLILQDNIATDLFDGIFNSNADDNAYVGYMYGTAGSSTYEATHANINNSTIKTTVDNWYVANLDSYSSYLVDAGFCNDRSVAPTANTWTGDDTALGYGLNKTFYGPYNRVFLNHKPQFACPNPENDLFTTSTSTKGNKALTYPIGLLTLDEVVYAGGIIHKNNFNYYLKNGVLWSTMSPEGIEVVDEAFIWRIGQNGEIGNVNVKYSSGVRPVINLSQNVEVKIGDGTIENPYVIKTN